MQHKTLNSAQRNKFLNSATYGILLIFFSFMFSLAQAQPGFLTSAVPNKHFPKPVATESIPTFIPPGSYPGLTGYTFYGQRNGGSCYNQTFDFDGAITPGDENVNVWAICHRDVVNYDNAVAYEVTQPGTGNILYRGTMYVGGDICNLQVGIIYENFQYLLVVAYWYGAGEIRLRRYVMTTPAPANPSGLIFDRDDLIYTLTTPASLGMAQHISLDCNDLSSFVVVWEELGSPIRMRAYNVSSSAYGPVHILAGSTINARIPDVALSEQVGLTGTVTAHIAYVETAGPTASIHKYLVDAGSLMSPSPIMALENIEPLTTPFGADWDDFQLKIDAPDHHAALLPNWAYTYFNNDNNKIKVRICNQTMTPVYNTYTVNDGSLLPPSSIPLPNMTNAGNAFPSIAYNPDGNGMYVAWHTNYDPFILGPLNNDLYTYSAQSQGYVSVFLKDDGTMLTNEYNRMDDNYLNNRIGRGIDPLNPQTAGYYPKTCFSKHNEGEKLMTLFSSHCELPNLIWNTGFGAAFLAEYGEDYNILFGAPYLSGIDYIFASTSIPSQLFTNTSAFLTQKQVDWYPASPLFRKVKEENNLVAKQEAMNVFPNPFVNTLHIAATSGTSLQVQIYDALGRLLASYSGSIAEVNRALDSKATTLAEGAYWLRVEADNKTTQSFSVIKN